MKYKIEWVVVNSEGEETEMNWVSEKRPTDALGVIRSLTGILEEDNHYESDPLMPKTVRVVITPVP